MDPADIDWKSTVSHYELDETYEGINAPKWLDFSAPEASIDDVAWFCRPDCLHPISYQDFGRWNPNPKAKLLKCNPEEIRSGEKNSLHRDANSKRRARTASLVPSPSKPKLNSRKAKEDAENQNPNMETAATLVMKARKETIKSSAEKKGVVVEEETRETQNKGSQPQNRLNSIFSTRNFFNGRDILNQIYEFCHELKKFAAGKESIVIEEKEKEQARKTSDEDKENASLREYMEEKKAPMSTKKSGILKKCELAVIFDGNKEKGNILREARAYPPTPQRFPSLSGHHQLKSSKAYTNSNSSSPRCKITKSRTSGNGVLPVLDLRREEEMGLIAKNEDCNRSSVTSKVEGSTVDMFWFVKPCAYIS